MQYTPQELKDRLLKGLDQDNNVVDMPMVLEAISILEKYPVSKEVLEQTRLGKYVNELRKKTDNKDLAKRAKSLVRKWQVFVSTGAAPSSVNGERVVPGGPASALPVRLTDGRDGSRPCSPISQPGTPSSGRSIQSPSLPTSGSRPTTPSMQYVHSKLSPKGMGFRPGTPSVHPTSPAVHAPSAAKVSPTAPGMYQTGSAPASPALRQCVPPASTPTNNGKKTSPVGIPCVQTTTSAVGSPHEVMSKTNVANKRKRRRDEQPDCDVPTKLGHLDNGIDGTQKVRLNGIHSSSSLMMDVHKSVSESASDTRLLPDKGEGLISANETGSLVSCDRTCDQNLSSRRGSTLHLDVDSAPVGDRTPVPSETARSRLEHSQSTPGITRTPKVKSTAELIRDMCSSGNLKIAGSNTVAKIALNQIEKEPDIIDQPVVPPEAKPRYRRKPGTLPPNVSDKTLSQTKTEMVEKFLESSVTPSPGPVMPTVGLTPTSSETDLKSFLLEESSRPTEETAVTGLKRSHSKLSQGAMDESISIMSDNVDDSRDLSPGSLSHDVNGASRDDTSRDKVTFSLGGQPITQADIDELMASLPPVNPEEIHWSDDEYEVPPKVEPTEKDTERLSTEQWPNVNGQYDYQHNWQDWTSTYSMPTYNGDLLHILPYVNIDD